MRRKLFAILGIFVIFALYAFTLYFINNNPTVRDYLNLMPTDPVAFHQKIFEVQTLALITFIALASIVLPLSWFLMKWGKIFE